MHAGIFHRMVFFARGIFIRFLAFVTPFLALPGAFLKIMWPSGAGIFGEASAKAQGGKRAG
jgi:hypothetical protein